MKWILILFMLSAVGCSKENKPCPKSKECGEGLKCTSATNMCRARCAKDNDCGKGLSCEMKHNICIDPILINDNQICQTSDSFCKVNGQCTAVDGVCKAIKDEDCAEDCRVVCHVELCQDVGYVIH